MWNIIHKIESNEILKDSLSSIGFDDLGTIEVRFEIDTDTEEYLELKVTFYEEDNYLMEPILRDEEFLAFGFTNEYGELVINLLKTFGC